jgi:hypothetical protein
MAEASNPSHQNVNANANANVRRAANPPQEVAPMLLVVDRPALLTFAALMAFMLAGFQAIWAIEEIFNTAWIAGTAYGTFGGYLWLWAILDLLIAGFSFYAGYDILRGGTFGFLYGVIVAGFSAIRWFFYLPAAPMLGVIIIAIDIFIIYGLVSNIDFFRARASR